MSRLPKIRVLLLLAAVVSMATFALLGPAVDTAADDCLWKQEWRWNEWWGEDCCAIDYPPGSKTYYFERLRRLQHRERINCHWTPWQDTGPLYSVCSTNHSKCPMSASNEKDGLPFGEGRGEDPSGPTAVCQAKTTATAAAAETSSE